jgi:hypothetical protein
LIISNKINYLFRLKLTEKKIHILYLNNNYIKMLYLSTFIAKIVLLFCGLVGNMIGLLVFARKSIDKKIKTKRIYQALLFIDSVFLFSQVLEDSLDSLNIKLSHMSIIACKLRGYWNFSIGAITIWYLVFITIERYLQIKFNHFKLLQQKNFQRLIIILVSVYSLVAYSPFAIFYSITTDYDSTLNETYIYCYFEDTYVEFVMFTFDTINASVLPFVIITIFSCLLIYTVISSRIRAMRMRSSSEKNKLLKDIRISISILIINLTILLTLPIQIANYFFSDLDPFLYDICCCVMYSYYCLDAYILYIINSNFRNEFDLMLSLK